jgi:LAO/AO transport system kinase
VGSSIPDLVTRARQGEVRALARLLTVLEGEWDSGPSEAMPLLVPHAGHAHVIGVTGPPGAGKSSLVDRLVAALPCSALGARCSEETAAPRTAGGPPSSPTEHRAPSTEHRIAVLLFDPSSPFTGGALLGDRIRMGGRALDPGVYIRSVANRAHAGGLSRTAHRQVTALDAAGYRTVLLETVGAGQSEVEILGLAHTVVVVLAPGFGDEIQALKAGLLEIADLLVVNKADLPGADRVAASLADATGRPILKTSATAGQGIEELVAAIAEHRAPGTMHEVPSTNERRRVRRAMLVEEAIRERLWRRYETMHAPELARMVERVNRGELDPETAADQGMSEECWRRERP